MVRIVAVGVVVSSAIADQCSDYACFGDSNNCRNYAKIQSLCGSSAVCRYNPAKKIDTCFTSFADDLTKSGTGDFLAIKDDAPTAGDICSDYACFGSDSNCRNYAKIQQLCGPNAVCQYNSAKGTSVCQPAAEELGAEEAAAVELEAEICTDKACFGDDNNCRNYQDIVNLCGPNAVCRYNPAKYVDTCYPSGGAEEPAALELGAEICTDKACFGDDNNCRNYQDIVNLCGPNAVCRYNPAKYVETCYPSGGVEEPEPAAVELGAEICTDKACFDDDNNCQNYPDIVQLCGPGAVCRYNPAKYVSTCYPR